MILAKYIFTISVDEEWNRTIQCELPPHDLTTKGGLYRAISEIDNVYSFCVDQYDEYSKIILDFPEEWNNLTDLPIESEKLSTEKQ